MVAAGKACVWRKDIYIWTGEPRPPSSTICRGVSPNLRAWVIYCKWLLVCAQGKDPFFLRRLGLLRSWSGSQGQTERFSALKSHFTLPSISCLQLVIRFWVRECSTTREKRVAFRKAFPKAPPQLLKPAVALLFLKRSKGIHSPTQLSAMSPSDLHQERDFRKHLSL